jgi:hypothetical protein
MRDDRPLPLTTRLLGAAGGVVSAASAGGVAASLAIVVTAGLVAPGDAPGAWVWLRVLAIWLLAAVALGTIAGVGSGGRVARPTSPIFVWGALLVAILISLSFDALTSALTVLGLILLLLTVPGGSGQPLAFWTVTVTVTPLWVWSAFEAWDRWLLMLVPIAAIGLVSLEHAVRAGHAGGDLAQSMAAWIGLLALAGATLLTALLGPVDPTWVIAGAATVAALAAIDLALARLPASRLSPVILPAVALVTLAFGWMAAL